MMLSKNFILPAVMSLALLCAETSGVSTVSLGASSVVSSEIIAERRMQAMPQNMSYDQRRLLNLAYEIAEKDGHQHPQILQGIILQETKAGDFRGPKNSPFIGVAQIKFGTAKDVLARYPDLKKEYDVKTDREVMTELNNNDRFNLAVASKYLLMMRDYGYNTIMHLALAYNQGAGGAKNKNPNTHRYSIGVMRQIKKINE